MGRIYEKMAKFYCFLAVASSILNFVHAPVPTDDADKALYEVVNEKLFKVWNVKFENHKLVFDAIHHQTGSYKMYIVPENKFKECADYPWNKKKNEEVVIGSDSEIGAKEQTFSFGPFDDEIAFRAGFFVCVDEQKLALVLPKLASGIYDFTKKAPKPIKLNFNWDNTNDHHSITVRYEFLPDKNLLLVTSASAIIRLETISLNANDEKISIEGIFKYRGTYDVYLFAQNGLTCSSSTSVFATIRKQVLDPHKGASFKIELAKEAYSEFYRQGLVVCVKTVNAGSYAYQMQILMKPLLPEEITFMEKPKNKLLKKLSILKSLTKN